MDRVEFLQWNSNAIPEYKEDAEEGCKLPGILDEALGELEIKCDELGKMIGTRF
jgi:hypothetical protein